MSKEINVLAMVKGEERYIFLYDDNHRVETLRMLGRYAADPQLSFSWYDAAVLSKKIRETAAAVDAGKMPAVPLPGTSPLDARSLEATPLDNATRDDSLAMPPSDRIVKPRFTMPQ